MPMLQTRREFLTTFPLAGAAGLLGVPSVLAAEGRLDTSSVRLTRFGGLCLSPQYVAEDLLHAEGFTDVKYVDINKRRSSLTTAIAESDADLTLDFAPHVIQAIDAGGELRCFPACIPAASSSSAKTTSIASPTSGARVSASIF